MNFPDNIKQQAGRFLSDNATTILTGVGVVGTVATAVLTGKAVLKAHSALEEQKVEWEKEDRRVSAEQDGHGGANPLTNFDKARAVWPYFAPPVVVGAATITSIIMANRMSAQRAAALAAAYGISENRLKEYREKMQEKLTGPKNQAINDEIAQDKVNANPPNGEVLILAEGDVLFYDMLTGRYFRCTVEKVRQAENEVNQELFQTQYASLSEFYDRIGLSPTQFTDIVGWNSVQDEGPLKVEFSTTLTPDSKPCIAINFNHIPKPDYHKMY